METTTSFKTKVLEIKTEIKANIDILAKEYTARMKAEQGAYGENTSRIHNMCNKLVPGHAPNLYNSIFLEVMCETHLKSIKPKKVKA
jgi:hypothetical protein